MKMSQLLSERYKERPADCKIESHAFMIRGGYIKRVHNGVFSLLTPMKKINQKIENIIRQEMDNIDGQEVLFPVVMPADLWKESGRYESVGSELVRLKDRNDNEMVLGMTHEEAAVDLAREMAKSYTKYPFMIYQIQTKFRDELRPRGGLIRVREFTMKDAYSFHTSQEDLNDYYLLCHKAYEKIFSRCGIPEVISVQSDSGMMGGSVSHEFMLLTDIGEDSLALCTNCDFKSNLEAAECIIKNEPNEIDEIQIVHTPNVSTIEDIAKYFNTSKNRIAKAVIYQENETGEYVLAFTRGDLEVSETKLRNYLGKEITPAKIEDDSELIAGFIGLYNLDKKFKIVIDKSLESINNLICGANKKDYHYQGFNIERDYGKTEYADISKAFEGGICPVCGQPTLTIKKGIEVGNIFQLGTKYTKSMNMTYIDQNDEPQTPIMGCYGIGVGRLAASVCEVSRDNFGPIWPMSIAPWQVHICTIRSDDQAVKDIADIIYNSLKESGIEVIFDDRQISAGVMFSEADLLGVPIRVTISPRNIAKNIVEVTTRDKSIKEEFEINTAVEEIIKLKNNLMNKYL